MQARLFMHNSKILIITILIICLIPSLGMIVAPSSAAGNEILSPEPELNIDLLKDAGNWVNDHFALRQQMITLWSKFNDFIFKTSAEDQVVLGKEQNLFYAKDFENVLTETDFENIALHLLEIQTEVESKGSEFIFTIAPDKSSIKSDLLPENLVHPGTAYAIEPYLEKYGINYVNLFDLDLPYFVTDSHFTNYGGALVCDALIGSDYSKRDFSIENTHTGDLYEMLYPSGTLTEENNECELNYKAKGFVNGGNAITIETESDGEGTLYCWRDSFGIYFYPFLADAFEYATFSRDVKFDVNSIGDADVVILEIVERNLSYLK